MAEVRQTSRPRLGAHARLQWDPVREKQVLLAPERVLVLNETAAAILRWLQRLVDHDGAAEGQGGIEAWLRLAVAVGLTREEVLDERHVLPGVRFAVDANVTFARTRPWVEAVAATLTELFAPDLMRERIAAFERFYPWVDPAGLGYFKARLTQAPRDASYALDLVIRHCTTRARQEQAVAALAFKCAVLWGVLDAIHHAHQAEGKSDG